MHTAARTCGVAAASGAISTAQLCRLARVLHRSSATAEILAPRSRDPSVAQGARRRPTIASAAPAASAATGPAMAPTERQFGEWESPITSDLITSAVSRLSPWPLGLGSSWPEARTSRRCLHTQRSCLCRRGITLRQRPKAPLGTLLADQGAGSGQLRCQRGSALAGGAANGERPGGPGPQVGPRAPWSRFAHAAPLARNSQACNASEATCRACHTALACCVAMMRGHFCDVQPRRSSCPAGLPPAAPPPT